jgi:hypothetical protein
MINRLRIAIPVVAVLVVASMAVAKDVGIPKLNIEYACHASEQAVSAVVSATNDIYKSCLDDENDARNQLNDAWAKFAASDKVRCIHSSEFLPSYVEWLTCLEMTRDVKQMRKLRAAPTSSDSSECPIVHFLEDGTITGVDTACR